MLRNEGVETVWVKPKNKKHDPRVYNIIISHAQICAVNDL